MWMYIWLATSIASCDLSGKNGRLRNQMYSLSCSSLTPSFLLERRIYWILTNDNPRLRTPVSFSSHNAIHSSMRRAESLHGIFWPVRLCTSSCLSLDFTPPSRFHCRPHSQVHRVDFYHVRLPLTTDRFSPWSIKYPPDLLYTLLTPPPSRPLSSSRQLPPLSLDSAEPEANASCSIGRTGPERVSQLTMRLTLTIPNSDDDCSQSAAARS
jgi:hypothetical protein